MQVDDSLGSERLLAKDVDSPGSLTRKIFEDLLWANDTQLG
jgi:hypothetical protein